MSFKVLSERPNLLDRAVIFLFSSVSLCLEGELAELVLAAEFKAF